jgi:hypothetical protein
MHATRESAAALLGCIHARTHEQGAFVARKVVPVMRCMSACRRCDGLVQVWDRDSAAPGAEPALVLSRLKVCDGHVGQRLQSTAALFSALAERTCKGGARVRLWPRQGRIVLKYVVLPKSM